MSFYELEDRRLLSLLKNKGRAVLDVGCGTGRYLLPLSQSGFNVSGVDINKTLVADLANEGHRVVSPDDVDKLVGEFDYVIMSHVIEHIEPKLLMGFMDKYIEKLRTGGHLIIATPCLYDEFYDDYDHVKPYTPKAIAVLYSDYEQQQSKPRHRLKLISVWFRTWPILLKSYPGDSLSVRRLKQLVNQISTAAFYASGHLIARKTGWIGVFEKV